MKTLQFYEEINQPFIVLKNVIMHGCTRRGALIVTQTIAYLLLIKIIYLLTKHVLRSSKKVRHIYIGKGAKDTA